MDSSCQYLNCDGPKQFGFPDSAPTVCENHKFNGMVQGEMLAPPTGGIDMDVDFQDGNIKAKRPRRDWAKEKFAWNDENKALNLINDELIKSAFQMVRNQPYDFKSGYVQIFKCNGKKKYGCECQWKLVYDVESSALSAFKSGTHFHDAAMFRHNLEGEVPWSSTSHQTYCD
jgi:hypothetical protein